MVTTLQKTSLVPGSDDSLIFTTISGAIGMLVPFLSRDVFIHIPEYLFAFFVKGIRIFPNVRDEYAC